MTAPCSQYWRHHAKAAPQALEDALLLLLEWWKRLAMFCFSQAKKAPMVPKMRARAACSVAGREELPLLLSAVSAAPLAYDMTATTRNSAIALTHFQAFQGSFG